jgi:rhamnulokinase
MNYVAFDLGAESGRAIVGSVADDRLKLEEVHRFPTGPTRVNGSLHWDALRFWNEIQTGLGKSAAAIRGDPAALGVDTWGVDFGLLDKDGVLLGNPYHYRDARTDGMLERAFSIAPRAEIYRRTGIQFMQLNSLYQLLAMAESGAPALQAARHFLTMPDLFNFWLCGRKANEFTNATTTQCYDPVRGEWALDLLEKFAIPSGMFGEIVQPGTVLETLRADVAAEAGVGRVPLAAVGSHDTASAVAAVPAQGEDFIYLSSGTWSLMGIEIRTPIINEQSLAADITNEGGLNGTFRFLKNIMGMWLLQESRREWSRQGKTYSYDDLTRMAAEAPAFGSLVNPGDARFLGPDGMPGRIQAYCRLTGQPVPQGESQIARCILESLALEYRRVAGLLEALHGRRLPVIHIIGGGSRNRLLNQFTANATGCQVVAGPVEATAIGNILAQMLALGHIATSAEGRALVRRSFDVTAFEPGDKSGWDAAYERYLKILNT